MTSANPAANPLQNAKHEAVLQAYFADPARVGFKAYLVVYPKSSQRAAETGFSRLLRNVEFAARLKFLDAGVTEKVVEATAISVESVVAELARIGFASMGDYVDIDEDGAPRLKFGKLNEAQLAAIAEITCDETIIAGDDEEKRVALRKTKFKLHNKQAALVSILDHLGGFPARKHADPDGRPLGTGAAEKLGEAMSELEVGRRVAFLLARADRAKKAKRG